MMRDFPPAAPEPGGERRRRLRAVLAADVANFSGLMSVDETNTVDALSVTRRIAREELDVHGGWLFGLPGDGIFALFESAVDAVRCALETQQRLKAMPKLSSIRLRVGVHLGEVVFQDGLPFGEALVIAARLESHADPGGILVSSAVMDAVAPRIAANFRECGVFNLKHSPRRITTYSVSMPEPAGDADQASPTAEPLDRTVLSVPAPPPVEADGPLLSQPHPASAMSPGAPVPEVVSLPKAAPLVVEPVSPQTVAPDPPLEAGPAESPARPPGVAVLPPDCAEELIQTLTRHIGPVAAVLVKRYASRYSDPLQFIDGLADEIPAEAERQQFRMRARQMIVRHNH
jgi:class 3 adenylate cyclase